MKLARAKKEGKSAPTAQPLAAKCLYHLRSHVRLTRASSLGRRPNEAKEARERCREDFWGYARGLFDGDVSPRTTPHLSADTARSYFSKVYKSIGRTFRRPDRLPVPSPESIVDVSLVAGEVLARVIGKSRASSSPSPLDCIPYLIFEKCPSLRRAILDLFKRVVVEGQVSARRKAAVVKLIPKSTAQSDPSVSAWQFRPIALASTVSELLSGILEERWLRHVQKNGWLLGSKSTRSIPSHRSGSVRTSGEASSYR